MLSSSDIFHEVWLRVVYKKQTLFRSIHLYKYFLSSWKVLSCCIFFVSTNQWKEMLCTGCFICIWMLIESVSINEECNGSAFSCKLSWKRVELQESCEVVRKWQKDPWVVRLHRARLRMFRAHLKTYQHSIFVFQGNILFLQTLNRQVDSPFYFFFSSKCPQTEP